MVSDFDPTLAPLTKSNLTFKQSSPMSPPAGNTLHWVSTGTMFTASPSTLAFEFYFCLLLSQEIFHEINPIGPYLYYCGLARIGGRRRVISPLGHIFSADSKN